MQPPYMEGAAVLLTGASLGLQKSGSGKVTSSLMHFGENADSLVGKVTAEKGPSLANGTVAARRT